jgi:Cu(I)/Ag(I) efflux system membrane fusion protein/cobalt-zinc-cadmium efflux system membrane fusion protein
MALPSGAPQANVEFTTGPSPPAKGNNTVRVKLTDAKGSPITGAQVHVTLYMAAMPAMGMAAMKTDFDLADKGNGVYEGKGELASGGTWQVTIVARRNGAVITNKQLSVNATGGM